MFSKNYRNRFQNIHPTSHEILLTGAHFKTIWSLGACPSRDNLGPSLAWAPQKHSQNRCWESELDPLWVPQFTQISKSPPLPATLEPSLEKSFKITDSHTVQISKMLFRHKRSCLSQQIQIPKRYQNDLLNQLIWEICGP